VRKKRWAWAEMANQTAVQVTRNGMSPLAKTTECCLAILFTNRAGSICIFGKMDEQVAYNSYWTSRKLAVQKRLEIYPESYTLVKLNPIRDFSQHASYSHQQSTRTCNYNQLAHVIMIFISLSTNKHLEISLNMQAIHVNNPLELAIIAN
jgi:hypothetical protein